MRLVILAMLLAFVAGCARTANEVLPLSREIVGNSMIADVRTVVHPSAAAAVAALDERIRTRATSAPGDPRQLPLADLVARNITESARDWGLTSGRRLRIIAEIDGVQVASVGGAMIGRQDRLTGTAFVRDHDTDTPLGQLYINIRRGNGGLIGTVLRGGGVRESLADEFADHIARALSGRRSPSR